MFRRLITAIFRLYMKYLLSSHTKHTWAVYMGQGGGEVGTRSRICQKCWAVWFTFHVQPADGHYQVPKHVVEPYVENTLLSTNRYSCVRRLHTVH